MEQLPNWRHTNSGVFTRGRVLFEAAFRKVKKLERGEVDI